jgi:exopolysaccharide biosynthesis polyprenyl glycosylphosphotransferase
MKLSPQALSSEPPVQQAGNADRHNQSNWKTKNDFWLDLIVIVAAIGDIGCFVMAMVLGFYGRRHLNQFRQWDLIELNYPLFKYAGHFIFGIALYLVLGARTGLYNVRNFIRLRQIFIAALTTVFLWAMFYVCLSLLFSIRPNISRLFVIFSAIFGFAFIIYWRMFYRFILNHNGILARLRQRLVIVGWNLEVDQLAHVIMQDEFHPYEIIGCLPSAHNKYRVNPPKGVKKLGDYQEIAEIHQRENIDIILLGDLDPNTREIIALCEFCQREMIQFKVVPTYFQILISGLHLETISGVPVLGIAKLPLDSLFSRLIKRAIDIVGALIGLVISVPLIVFFGLSVYLESPGPVIYHQNRMGRRGELFRIYKIRSMRLDAEKDGAQWARPNDNRRLKIGAFLRKWNIDEIPQFWNVLIGQMSLVGPRPERPELIKDFKDQIRYYNARHNVKPGMTGWAQIHGLRGNTDLNERLRYDLYYLENWTPVLDIYIMLMTFRGYKNAY